MRAGQCCVAWPARRKAASGARRARKREAGQGSEVAPGGVEPPHTDSKSVALSAELRGRGLRRVDAIRELSARVRGLQIVDQDAGHSLPCLSRRAAEMRSEHDVGQLEKLHRHARLIGEDV